MSCTSTPEAVPFSLDPRPLQPHTEETTDRPVATDAPGEIGCDKAHTVDLDGFIVRPYRHILRDSFNLVLRLAPCLTIAVQQQDTYEIPDWSWFYEPTSPVNDDGPVHFYEAPSGRGSPWHAYPYGLDDAALGYVLNSLPVPRRTELADVRDRWLKVEGRAFPGFLDHNAPEFMKMVGPRGQLDEELLRTFVALLEGHASVGALVDAVDRAITSFSLMLAAKGLQGGPLANHLEPWLPVECCGASSAAQVFSLMDAELARSLGKDGQPGEFQKLSKREPTQYEETEMAWDALLFAEEEATALRRAGLRSRDDERVAIKSLPEIWAEHNSPSFPSIPLDVYPYAPPDKRAIPFAPEMGRPKVTQAVLISEGTARQLLRSLGLDVPKGAETLQSILDWRCPVDVDISRAREAKLEAVDAGVAQVIASCGAIGITALRKELKDRGEGMREKAVVDSVARLVRNEIVQATQIGRRWVFTCQLNSSQNGPKVDA